MAWVVVSVLALASLGLPGVSPDGRDDDSPTAVPTRTPSLKPSLLPRPPIVDEHLYHRYPDLTVELQNLAQNYPDTAKLASIGRSVEGRELWQMEITDFSVPDGGKHTIYVDGGHHGNEQLGMELAVQLIHEAVEGRLASSEILAKYHFFIVPMVNPDGNMVDQRTNANGVDLNRNYGFEWTDESNHGSGPESEPEAHANAESMRQVDRDFGIDLYLSGHTGTNVLIYSWAYTLDLAPDDELLARIGASANNLTGVEYGQTSHLLYIVTGSSKDLAYGELGAPGFTYEVDDQQNRFGTYTTTIAERLSQEVNVCLLIIEEVEFMRADVRPVAWLSRDTPEGPVVAVTLENRGWGAAENATASLAFTSAGGRVREPAKLFSVGAQNRTTLEFPVESGGGTYNLSLSLNYRELLVNNTTVNQSVFFGNLAVKGSGLGLLFSGGGGLLLLVAVAAVAAVVLEDRFGRKRVRAAVRKTLDRGGPLKSAVGRLKLRRGAPP